MHNSTFSEKHAFSKAPLIKHFILEEINLPCTTHFFILVKLSSETCLFLSFWVSQTKLLTSTVSLVILIVPTVLYHAELCLHSQNWISFPLIVFESTWKVCFIVSCRVFTRSVSLSSFNLTFKLVPIAKVNHTFLRIHLVIEKTSKVLWAVLENHLSKSLKRILAHLSDI